LDATGGLLREEQAKIGLLQDVYDTFNHTQSSHKNYKTDQEEHWITAKAVDWLKLFNKWGKEQLNVTGLLRKEQAEIGYFVVLWEKTGTVDQLKSSHKIPYKTLQEEHCTTANPTE
jgi:hypothetical protein